MANLVEFTSEICVAVQQIYKLNLQEPGSAPNPSIELLKTLPDEAREFVLYVLNTEPSARPTAKDVLCHPYLGGLQIVVD